MRRNICDFNVSIDSTQTNSGSSRTTENPTEQTVVQRGVDDGGAQSTLPRPQIRCSTHSLLAAKEQEAEEREDKEEQDEDSQGDHLSSEDNLSHESYDLLEEPPCGSFSDNLKTAVSRSELSFDNSLSYNYAGSMPHTPSKGLASPGEPRSLRDPDYDTVRSVSLREDLVNSKNVKSLVPPLPREVAVSFYLQSWKLIFAVYHMVTDKGVSRFDRYQAECVVPWVNDVLLLLTVALQVG